MDLNHYFSADLAAIATGDIATAEGITVAQQRIVRRILTNPGDYIWHPDYGCGAPLYVGEPTGNLGSLKAKILSQLSLEPSVSMAVTPEILLKSDGNVLTCTIKYIDAETGTSQILTFDTGAL